MDDAPTLPVTWAEVRALMESGAGVDGLTNRSIAELLNADQADVTHLTRLMWKAGEIRRFVPGPHKQYQNFYFPIGSPTTINRNSHMNASRVIELERGLNMTDKKILDMVPFTDPWTVNDIHKAIDKLGRKIERKTLCGALLSLRDVGLIKDVNGAYIRVSAKQKTSSPALPTAEPTEPAASPDTVNKATTLDRLADGARNARNMAAQLMEMASNLEEVALEVEERIQQASAESAKFRQFRELLKSVD